MIGKPKKLEKKDEPKKNLKPYKTQVNLNVS